jgi:hypothetical protein
MAGGVNKIAAVENIEAVTVEVGLGWAGIERRQTCSIPQMGQLLEVRERKMIAGEAGEVAGMAGRMSETMIEWRHYIEGWVGSYSGAQELVLSHPSVIPKMVKMGFLQDASMKTSPRDQNLRMEVGEDEAFR